MTDPELHFDKPPVRLTRLTLRFEPTGHIQASHVAPLRDLWRSSYPEVTESVPTPDPDGPNLLRLSGDSPTWPLAYTEYHSEGDDRVIGFQGDRLHIEWRFSSDAEYPGFNVLVGELEERLADFTKTLEDEAGIQLQITASECRYENLIANVSASQLAVGLLTNWRGSPGDSLPSTGYVGVRIHACSDEANHHCSSYVAADGDTDEDSVFSISVLRRAQDDDDSRLGGLDDAHQELLSLFLSYTSEAQHDDWGRKS